MQLSVVVNSLLLIAALTITSLLVAVPPVGSVEVESVTDISVSVCGQPEVILNKPTFESSQLSNQFLIYGTVRNVSQVEIYINDVFDQVIAIPAGDTSFRTSISVSRGDLLIEARGIGICGLRQSYDYEEVTNFVIDSPELGDGPGAKDPATNLPISDNAPSLPLTPQSGLETDQLKDKYSALNKDGIGPKLANLSPGLRTIGLHTVLDEGWLHGLLRVVLIVIGSIVMALGSASHLLLMKIFKKSPTNLASLTDISLRFGGLGLFIIGILL